MALSFAVGPSFAAPVLHEIEPNDLPATANPIPSEGSVVVGNALAAASGPGPVDTDVFSFVAEAGSRVYAATMTAFGSSGTNSRLELLDQDGSTVIELDNDDGSLSTLSSSIAGAVLPGAGTGTYFLRVTPINGTLTPYHLHLQVRSGAPTLESEGNDNAATAQPLPSGGWVSGTRGSSTDQDWFRLTLAAGDTIYLSLDLDPERDAVQWNGRLGLGFFGDASDVVLRADDGSTGSASNPLSEALFVRVEQEGAYYVVVDAAAAMTGTYQLSVSVRSASPPTSRCTTYMSSDVPRTIPAGGGTVVSSLSVPGSPRIADLDVAIRLQHASLQDVDVLLRSPVGNVSGLFTDLALLSQTEVNTTLDDEAAAPIGAVAAAKGLDLQPAAAYRLDWFDGENAGGVWQLEIRDDLANAFGGSLVAWSLTVCEPEPAPACEGSTEFVAFSFESDDGGFIHSGNLDEWAWGSVTSGSSPIGGCGGGTRCWKTDLGGTYSNFSIQDLVSPPIVLSSYPRLEASWMQAFQMEDSLRDHLFVEVREVGGANPKKLFEWFGPTMSASMGNPPATIAESAGWGAVTADLSAYAGRTIELRFHLDSNVSGAFSGFAIDDVRITGCCTEALCDDVNPCTTEACDPSGRCVHTDVLDCDDGNSCTDDFCDPSTFACAQAARDCDDANPCTDDVCSPAVGCISTADDANDCSTGDSCVLEYCSGGVCVAESPCDDGNSCTVDTCQAATGQCWHSPVSCDDANPCTDDYPCDPTTGMGCVNVPDDTNQCADTDNCTVESCVAGSCQVTSVNCDDGDPCTVDRCDPGTGTCSHVVCDDGNLCTADTCVGGQCFHSVALDGTPCFPPCAASASCQQGVCVTHISECGGFTPPCYDRVCVNGGCQTIYTCPPDDGNPCTDWICNNGCFFAIYNGPTTPTNACYTAVCSGPSRMQTPITCDDGNPCTRDECDTAIGCVYRVDDRSSCSDADACTVDDCSNGGCTTTPVEPGEVAGGVFTQKDTFAWTSAPADLGPVSWDVVRGLVHELPVGSGPSEQCLASALLEPALTDPQAPPSNRAFWYLVRIRSGCGIGTYGYAASNGTSLAERMTTACP